MNVGSILNGDSPSEDTKFENQGDATRPVPPPMVQKHSITNLLNDSPATAEGLGKQESDEDKSFQDDDEDVDSAAEMIDRELEIQSQMEKEQQDKKIATAESKASEPKQPIDGENTLPKSRKSLLPKSQKPPLPKNGSSKSNNIKREKPHSPRNKTHSQIESKGSLVLSEINRLNELKKTKWKPKRYSEPPIWAQQYMSPSQQEKLPFSSLRLVSSLANVKPVFDRGSMQSGDLECLITGVIPPQSTVRTIAEWIYANFVEISVENRQYVELELKFGTLMDKTSGRRLAIGVSSECIFTDTSAINFELSVHEAGWKEIKTFMDELEKQYQEENRRDPTKPRKKFAVTETDNIDYFYSCGERNEKPQKIRITKDQLLTPPRYTGIEKKRLSDIHIFNPSSMFDFRLSLNLEMPIPEGSVEPTMKNNKIALQRGKKRTSFTHSSTVTRFDFTEVFVPKPSRNKAGKAVASNETSYELELELDTFLIFRGFDKVRDGLDSIRFEELVEVFLNNARCCNNRVTKFASK